MPSLRDLQQAFSAVLIGDANERMAPFLVERVAAGRNAMSVYRNNVREAFYGTLKTTYPVLERLVGPDYFRQMARSYQNRHPSRAGNLFYIGQMLPRFLQSEFAGTEYDYFCDVARLEWSCQQALVAADSDALDARALLAVEPDAYPWLRFRLHPSVQLLSSNYPLLRIWRDNQPDSLAQDIIDLAGGGDLLLVRREVDAAEIRRLDAGQFALLSALKEGECLADALIAAENSGVEIDPGASLANWVALGIVVGFSLNAH